MVGTGACTHAAIIGLDGNTWATSAGFAVSAAEGKAMVAGFSNSQPLAAAGVKVSLRFFPRLAPPLGRGDPRLRGPSALRASRGPGLRAPSRASLLASSRFFFSFFCGVSRAGFAGASLPVRVRARPGRIGLRAARALGRLPWPFFVCLLCLSHVLTPLVLLHRSPTSSTCFCAAMVARCWARRAPLASTASRRARPCWSLCTTSPSRPASAPWWLRR